MEVCAGFELIAIENTTTRGDDLLEIGKGREAQMIGYMRHGAPPRLMAPQSVRSADLRESNPTPPPGNRMTLAKGHHESELSILRGWHRGSGRVARHRTGALAHMRLSHYGFKMGQLTSCLLVMPSGRA
jgi:hypothetical protein